MAINHTAQLQSVVYSFNNGSLYTSTGKATKEDLVPHFVKALLALRELQVEGKITFKKFESDSFQIFNLSEKLGVYPQTFSALVKKLTE